MRPCENERERKQMMSEKSVPMEMWRAGRAGWRHSTCNVQLDLSALLFPLHIPRARGVYHVAYKIIRPASDRLFPAAVLSLMLS